ncbi:hypothetical protein AB0H83_25390 [Dactylosporangium sp. NPDC050688]|uniref:hypothetical protein n=1 Tax=Dactylosporangium sp. NPDC050688 TaxID=3157217 RepID=UPI00340ABF20
MDETLGVPAHPGGIVVDRPELRVGVVQAVSRPTGLELELIARQPLDRRSATERQADIRAGRPGPAPAPRRLLPQFDEGMDLRVGWLDSTGRTRWTFGSRSMRSGDHFGGTTGPSLRTVLRFPPLYDHASVVLAWPEIGFPETVLELDLPDRATVERDTVSVWDAPVDAAPVPADLRHIADPAWLDEPEVEAGRIVAAPRVLSRGDGAVVVLSRLTAVGAALSLQLRSMLDGPLAEAAGAAMADPARHRPGRTDDPEQLRAGGPGAAVAVVHGRDAVWARSQGGTGGAGDRTFRAATESTAAHPGGNVLDLLVAWPAAGLPDVKVRVPLGEQDV